MTDNPTVDQTTAPQRRTKRRYAYELYPHPDEWQTRPLTTEVPYLYARAIGLDVWGTGWFDLHRGEDSRRAANRTQMLNEARRTAFLADALLQGMTGDEAWAWADDRFWNYGGAPVHQRATHYGVPVDQIKPYACGPEPDHHDHYAEPDARGWQLATRIACKESECPDCTEDIPDTTTEGGTA